MTIDASGDAMTCTHENTTWSEGNEWSTCDACHELLPVRGSSAPTIVSRELARFSDAARVEIAERMWTIAVRYGADRDCAACQKFVRKIANGRDEGHLCGRHCWHTFRPNWTSPPGDTIQNIATERGWSADDAARELGLEVADWHALVRGDLAITLELAGTLAHVLGSTTRFWLSRESLHRADVLRLHVGNDAAAGEVDPT